MSFLCHSYVTRMYSYVIRMSLACHPYITRMYSYVIRMSLVCTRMSPVCHSYVLVCHLYVTRLWFYHGPVETACIIFLIVFFATVQISMECEMQDRYKRPSNTKQMNRVQCKHKQVKLAVAVFVSICLQ